MSQDNGSIRPLASVHCGFLRLTQSPTVVLLIALKDISAVQAYVGKSLDAISEAVIYVGPHAFRVREAADDILAHLLKGASDE